MGKQKIVSLSNPPKLEKHILIEKKEHQEKNSTNHFKRP